MIISHCRRCHAPIVWLNTKTKKVMPVNADGVREGDTEFDHTRHTSHFATCKFADYFRRVSKSKSKANT
jgi:hypothetical protein